MEADFTPADLARTFRVSAEFVKAKARTGEWPCHIYGPRTIRFTADQVATIRDLSMRSIPVTMTASNRKKVAMQYLKAV